MLVPFGGGALIGQEITSVEAGEPGPVLVNRVEVESGGAAGDQPAIDVVGQAMPISRCPCSVGSISNWMASSGTQPWQSAQYVSEPSRDRS